MKSSKIHLRSLVKDIIDGFQHIIGKKKMPAEIIRTQIVISVKKKKKKKWKLKLQTTVNRDDTGHKKRIHPISSH